MQNNFKLSSKDYKILAGADWPTYSDYLQGKMNKRVSFEIQKFEQEICSNTRPILQINVNYIFKYVLPNFILAVLALWLFFYLDGTIEKFILLFFVFRIKNYLWHIVVHKWLCHYQFEPKKWARPILLSFTVIGSRIGTGASPIGFIKAHWCHHKNQDTEIDPYPVSWGLLNMMLIGEKPYKTYPLGRWLIAPDIKFVMRNWRILRLLYWTVFAFIDIHYFILSFVFMGLYDSCTAGFESYLYHDGFRTGQPIDKYHFLGYPIVLFLGSNWMHKSHTDNPWVFNCSTINPKLIDLEYHLLKIFAEKECGYIKT